MGRDPGKRTQQAASQPANQPDVSAPGGVPGKSTLVASSRTARASDIGDPYIEDRGACANGGPGCELTPHQFDLLVKGYQGRVQAAQLQYSAALNQIRFERMLEKAEDVPILLSMVLDVLAGTALGSVMSVMRMVKGGAVVSLDRELEHQIQTGSGERSDRPSMTVLLAGMDETSTQFVAKAGIDQAKRAIAKPSPTDKQMALDYMTQLERVSAIAWEHQREDPPGYATHADMIVLFHSFKMANGHTTPDYKAALQAKIDRYVASQAARIGRHVMRTQADIELQGNTMRDTKVIWVRRASNPTVPTLFYYKQDFANSQSEHTIEHPEIRGLEPIDKAFKIDRAVENEFVDTAIEKHRAAWGTEPETQTLADDLIPKFAPPRDVRDLSQFVPQRPDSTTVRDPTSINNLNQFVPQNNPSFTPIKDPASAPRPVPVAWRPK